MPALAARQTDAMQTRPHLQLVTGATPLLTEDGFARVVDAMRAGIDSVQIRERGATGSMLLAAAQRILPAASDIGIVVTINDRADIALALLAIRRSTIGGSLVPVGVHLAGHSIPVGMVRHHLPLPLVGASIHSVDEARAAERDGADYVTFGHVFPSNSHPDRSPQGLDRLREVVSAVSIPVFAIGGIDAGNAGDVLATGCAGVTVISAILAAADPAVATRELRAALDRDPPNRTPK